MVKENSTNSINKREALVVCPVTITLDKIGGRWKPLILFHLSHGTRRYSELKRSIPAITEKMLIQHLRELEKDNLVKRTVMPVVPPHVEYSLTKTGKELSPVLEAMAAWGLKNNPQKNNPKKR